MPRYGLMQTRRIRPDVAIIFVIGVLASLGTSPIDEDNCQTDVDIERCVGACDDLADLLREPLAPPPSTTGRCVRFGGEVGCGCFADDERDLAALGGDDLRFPEDVFINDGPCSLFGRLGECLFDPAAFAGCTLSVSQGGVLDDESSEAICIDVCTTVDERRLAAAAPRANPIVDESQCDLECSCRIRDGEACGVTGGIVQVPERMTPDEANDQIPFTACAAGEL